MRKMPTYDSVCFHAQQCAEKYLKARLQAATVTFPKTHDLPALLDLLIPDEPEWELLRNAAVLLSDYAVRYRYPGASATKEHARDALRSCKLIRERVRQRLGLPAGPLRLPTRTAAGAKTPARARSAPNRQIKAPGNTRRKRS